jgi:hypothetical protein
MKVKITKIGKLEEPRVQTADWSEYTPGGFNSLSPPVEYTIKAVIHDYDPIEVGGFIRADRYERNGESVEGIFNSSRITKVENENGNLKVTTGNSVYLIEKINE